jgi:hypothetical protein
MLFFKRILKEPKSEPTASGPAAPAAPPPEVPAEERRSSRRFKLQPEFPLKALLSYVGRDDTGAPMSSSRHGWNWKGRLLDCSDFGARMQLGPGGLRAVVGEACDLRIGVDDFEINVPCHVTNIREQESGMIFGLRHDIEDAATLRDYRQFVEVVALGSTLKLKRKSTKPDESGYFVEHYGSSRPSSLTIWRHPANTAVAAFEFILKDSMVRAVAGRGLEFFAGDDTGSRPATPVRSIEILRLFQWVVANLPPEVPEDVRGFLGRYTA